MTAAAGIDLGSFAAAYRGDGRLWPAWVANPNFNRQSLRFALVAANGRRGPVYRVPAPPGQSPTRLSLQPIRGDLLVLAGVPAQPPQLGSSPVQLWADHVAPRASATGALARRQRG